MLNFKQKSLFLKSADQAKFLSETSLKIRNLNLYWMFERQVKLNPSNVAIITTKQKLTYKELGEHVVAIAYKLSQLGIHSGSRVAILLSKDWLQCATVLAVLRLNAIFIPLSTDWPLERIRRISERVKPEVICLNQDDRIGSLGMDLPEIYLDQKDASPYVPFPATAELQEKVAYILFTSGTTGEPKGVICEHEGVLNTIEDVANRIRLSSQDVWLTLSNVAFDFSLCDLFCALSYGAALAIPNTGRSLNIGRLWDFASIAGVTIWASVPSYLEAAIEEQEARATVPQCPIRCFISGGDLIRADLPQRTKRLFPRSCFLALGGVTEVSIWSMFYWAKDSDRTFPYLPYGRPLRHQSAFVLDDELNICPPGVKGEIYFGGRGLAAGYYADPRRTAEVFITHPVNGQRLYRTGDLGLYLDNDDIVILGRKEGYVKINGLRIELGEIEATLRAVPGIKKSVCLLYRKNIYAFICCDPTKDVSDTDILNVLHQTLPSYMIPVAFYRMDELPLSINGKVDRRALSETLTLSREALPNNKSDRNISILVEKLYRQVLGESTIVPGQSFILSGGTSIHAVRLSNLLNSTFQVHITVPEILANGSLEEISALIRLSELCRKSFVPGENLEISEI